MLIGCLFVWAEEAPVSNIDSVSVDMIVNLDPEWYVAPLSYDSLIVRQLVPRRAAAFCPIDSVRIFDADSVLTGVSVYENGDTTRTLTWTVNPDGSRIGDTKRESAVSATNVYNASYVWDDTANDWKGAVKTEKIYNAAGLMISNTTSDWVDSNWMPLTRYTYGFDADNREIEYLSYSRDSNNVLKPVTGLYHEYGATGQIVSEIQYTAYGDTAWKEGTKEIRAYDDNRQIEHAFYSFADGSWVGTSREIWAYEAAKLTYHEMQTWSDDTWIGVEKEIWEFNAKGKQTLYEKYLNTGGNWVANARNINGYDAANRSVLIETYTFTNGIATGTKKVEYTYWGTTSKKTATINYKWTNGAWENNSKVENAYDDQQNLIEVGNYAWKDTAWIGTKKTLTTYNSSKKPVDVITLSWSAVAGNWINATRKMTEYTGAKATQETNCAWSADLNDWAGTTRTAWHYNESGLNDTTVTSVFDGADWIYADRTINTGGAYGSSMTHKSSWNGAEWRLVSMTRTDIIKDDAGHQLLNASWRCGSDSVWIGVQKDSAAYSAAGKQIFAATYTSWANGDWVPSNKKEYEYDEAGHKTMEQGFEWKNDMWQGQTRHEYGFDAQGRQVMSASYLRWDNSSESWVGNSKEEKTYNSNGKQAHVVKYTWNYDTNQWRYLIMYDYAYDAANHEIEQITQRYSEENNEWIYTMKYCKEYDGAKQIKNNAYIWLNNTWIASYINELYYDSDFDSKLRHEIVGLWNNGEVASFSDKRYYYDCDFSYYTIRFENYDGTLLQAGEVKETHTPSYTGATPAKPATSEYTYTFAGWTPVIVPVVGDAAYTATFSSTVNTYLITFKNGETVLQSGQVAYGETPVYNGETPAKDGNEQYTYTFVGWDKELVAVEGDATYTATFTATKNTYTITWLNSDNSPLYQEEVEYGTIPAYTGETPTKQGATAEYTYTFAGWDKELVAVEGDATYTATFTATKNTYTITWLNSDNSPLYQEEVEYGTIPAYTGETPTKQGATAEYTYTFAGWDKELVAVEGDATYTATFTATKNTYTITWLNSDNSPLYQEEVAYGETPAYTGETPTKQCDAEYTYTFAGWDAEPAPVTGAAIYKAVYSSNKNSYTVTFYLDGGTIVLESGEWEYGATPSTTATPSKDDEEHYYYTFAGWTPEIVPVTGDASYTPTFKKEPKQYTITFNNYNGRTLWSTTVPYGETPEYNGETPSRPRTQQYTYEFAGWSPELGTVSGDATYTAIFEEILNQYTVIFLNEDGTELDRQLVDYGTLPEYNGETPTKEPDAEYRYEFAGWTPRIVAVFTDATYTATYTSHDLHEGIDDVQSPCMEAQKVLRNGTFYILRGDNVYTLDGVLVE